MHFTVGDAVWGGILVAGLGAEGWFIYKARWHDTLSDTTRSVFRVNTRGGRLVFGATWVAFATWFLFHILGG